MRKRWFSTLLALVTALTLLPAAAFAQEETGDIAVQAAHTHCICGGSVTAGDHTSHSDVNYTAWNGTDSITYTNNVAHVYLTGDATINNLVVSPGKTLYLCLGGKTYKSNGTSKINVGDSSKKDKTPARLVLCDCQGGGTIQAATTGWGGMGVYLYNSTLDMFGGKITGGKVTGNGGGGAIALDDKNCVFNMYGGEISSNNGNNYGGAVFQAFAKNKPNATGGAFNMYGGVIQNNTAKNGGAFFSTTGGTIKMTGGTISGNKATQNNNNAGGGAIYLRGNGKIDISGSAEITGNSSSLDGGAILMGWGEINISGSAKINNNTASRWGGAICLRQDSNQSTTLYMRGGEISGNKATQEGGAVHVLDKDCQFFLYDGRITGNTSGDGGAIYLNQEPSWLIMQGGEISGNTATGNGGGVYIYRSNSVCQLYGGKIEKNKASGNGGGIYINPSNSGQLKVGNTAVVKGNTVSGKANNVYLPSGKTLTIEIGMSTGASIGVTTADTSYPVVFSNAYNRDYANCFFADDTSANVEYKDDQKLYLVSAPAQSYILTFDPNDGTGGPGTMFRADNTFTIPQTVPTREGFHFTGWADTAASSKAQYQPGETVIITDGTEKTLYAVWKSHGTDADSDGLCDGCGECLHTKGTDGFCTVSSCTHPETCACGPRPAPVVPVLTPPTVSGTFYAFDEYGTVKKALTGGSAEVNGKPIEGTFSFDENELLYGFQPFNDSQLRAGELTRTVIFTPTNTAKYAPATCTVTVTVHKLKVGRVTSLFFDITDKDIGTSFEGLNLQKEISFTTLRGTVEGTSHYSDTVIWDESTYDANNPYEQTITGTLKIVTWADSIEQPAEPVTVSIKVRLNRKQDVPTIVKPPVFRWSKGDFQLGDNQIFAGDYLDIRVRSVQGEATETSRLVGGEASFNGQKVDGTFSLKKAGWIRGVGTHDVVVVFTPEDTTLYAPVEYTIRIEAIKRTAARIIPWMDITDCEVGTAFADLQLPPRTAFYTEDGSYYPNVPVTWDEAAYNPDSTAEQTITGTLDFDRSGYSSTVQQSEPELKDTIKVKLIPHDWSEWQSNGDGTHSRTCSHDVSHTETKNCSGGTATCLARAVCKDCGAEYGNALGHDFSEWKHDNNEHWMKCSRCDEIVGKKEHLWDSGKVTSQPTCTEPGEKIYTCGKCGRTKPERIDATGHSWKSEWTHDEAHHWHECANGCDGKDGYAEHTGGTATCLVKAVCKDCHVEYGEKNSGNHVGTEEWTNKTAAAHEKKWSCCGAVSVPESTHNWSDGVCRDCGYACLHADDNEDHICDLCGKTVSRHSGGKADCLHQAVCELCGQPYGEKATDTHAGGCVPAWTSDKTHHQQKYSLCGKVIVAEADHRFGAWTVTQAPTASKAGERVRSCEDCQYQETETIPATGGSGYSYYTIQAAAGANGAITPSGNVSVRAGRDQTFTITPDQGYAVSEVKVDGKSVGAVETYTFENVRQSHTIEVSFAKHTFVDVPKDSYYEEAVKWAEENGITAGTDATHFSPNGICTRGQAVTFLWRAAGSPAPKASTMPFTDVKPGSYCYDAVLWAVENGITKGTTDTTFSPNAHCTRAQIVTFLWRAEQSPAAEGGSLFTDVAATAYYAAAVRWAVERGITKGTTDTTFSPNAPCTRAQIVTFLYRATMQ